MAAAATIVLLNMDTSFPSGYSANPTASQVAAGTLRFLAGADQNSVAAMSRVFGDLVVRLKADESKINELASLLNANPSLSTFDNTPYSLVNGSHPFTAPVVGVTPTQAAHLATKSYVDGKDANQGTLIQNNATAITALSALVPVYRQSDWVTQVWNGGVKDYLDLTLTAILPDVTKVVNIHILERLNIGTIPSPVWVYRQLVHGTSSDGIRVDDAWLFGNNKVRVLIPNTSSFASGYPTAAQYNLSAAVQRQFKAVITALQ